MTTLSTQRPFELAWIPPGSAAINPDQYVEHPDHQLDALRGILYGRNAPGWAGAVIVNQRTAEQGWPEDQCGPYFIDGHARDEVAQQAGAAEIPALIGHWTPAEEKQLIALINPLAMMAVPVPEKQLQLLEDAARLAEDPALIAALTNLAAAAATALELLDAAGGGLAQEERDAEPQLDRAAELQKEWGTAVGQLWRLPSRVEGQFHLLACGDSRDAEVVSLALGGDEPLLMVTDPPYGVEYDPEWRAEAGVNKSRGKMGKVANDDVAYWSPTWRHFKGDVAYVYHAGVKASTTQASLESCGFGIRAQIIWAKDRMALSRGDYHWQHEPCWYAVRNGRPGHRTDDRTQTTVWSIPAREDAGHGHGTQKPLECMARPIRNHDAPVVYDPFVGSGTSIIACENLSRQCRASELSPEYVAVALQRYLDAFGLRPEMVG